MDDTKVVLGDSVHIYKYLCRVKGVDESLYPIKDVTKDKRREIDSILEWIQW